MSYTHYVLGPILGAEDTAVKKILKILPLECYIPRNKQNGMAGDDKCDGKIKARKGMWRVGGAGQLLLRYSGKATLR